MLDEKPDPVKLDLKDLSLLETRAYVGGQWITKEKTFPVYNPANGDCIAHVTDMDVADTANGIDVTYDAKADWAAWTGKERSAVLRKWHDLMIANADDRIAVNVNVTTDTGDLALDGDLDNAVDTNDDIAIAAGLTLTSAGAITLDATNSGITASGAVTLNAQNGVTLNDSLERGARPSLTRIRTITASLTK